MIRVLKKMLKTLTSDPRLIEFLDDDWRRFLHNKPRLRAVDPFWFLRMDIDLLLEDHVDDSTDASLTGLHEYGWFPLKLRT
jgi:hypothetical protein